ncbi:MAG TPA: protease modulator HflC [bacterium]|nr:protease modulator HflC [bacterium]
MTKNATPIPKGLYLLGGFILLAIVVNMIFFTVDETEQAVILQFGKFVRTIREPGLHAKVPYPIQTVRILDKRVLEYDSEPREIVTGDKKTLVIDNYARWRISDPLLFMKKVVNEAGAQTRLDDIVYSVLRVDLGKHNLDEIVLKRGPIMDTVSEECTAKMTEFGIEIVNVRIKRADLPEENERAVFERMEAERSRKAKQYRAEGRQTATEIKAETDKERTVILAEAYKQAKTTEGEGDAEATEIYAEAFSQDVEFYQFWRTLQAYNKTVDNRTTLVIAPDSPFFKYLRSGARK